MSNKCYEGVEIPWEGPCPVCGAYDFQPCGQRAKKIADRVEARRIDAELDNILGDIKSSFKPIRLK